MRQAVSSARPYYSMEPREAKAIEIEGSWIA